MPDLEAVWAEFEAAEERFRAETARDGERVCGFELYRSSAARRCVNAAQTRTHTAISDFVRLVRRVPTAASMAALAGS